jgi:hypothetical protein
MKMTASGLVSSLGQAGERLVLPPVPLLELSPTLVQRLDHAPDVLLRLREIPAGLLAKTPSRARGRRP